MGTGLRPRTKSRFLYTNLCVTRMGMLAIVLSAKMQPRLLTVKDIIESMLVTNERVFRRWRMLDIEKI